MSKPIEIQRFDEIQDLGERILKGEVFLLRRGLQQFGIYDTLVDSTMKGLRTVLGGDATRVCEAGFERVHEYLGPQDLPAVTDAISAEVTPTAKDVAGALVKGLFPDSRNFYFERHPNVRFHIPYDLANEQRKEFSKFASTHGEGKITAHGPHRDQWVDCPENAINLWIAVGPVKRGNGMGIFVEEYDQDFAFKDGYIRTGRKFRSPMTLEMDPGDVFLFHGKHLHASELNRTNDTRYVISYRVTLEKPRYPFGHYHHYLHGRLASGLFARFAEVPQNLQWSFVRYQFQRLLYRMTNRGRMTGQDSERADVGAVEPVGDLRVLQVGEIRAISKTMCATRLADGEIVSFSRRCPHAGGDLATGWIEGDHVNCPLHLMTFDLRTGRSPCQSLAALRSLPLPETVLKS